MSPISSRNSVPPCACSTWPLVRAAAPVKAPFSYPNSSDATRPDGIAAQLTATKGPVCRFEFLNGAGDHFLARAAFAGNQHRLIGLRIALQHLRHRLHGGAFADDVGFGRLGFGRLGFGRGRRGGFRLRGSSGRYWRAVRSAERRMQAGQQGLVFSRPFHKKLSQTLHRQARNVGQCHSNHARSRTHL
jgi:hypothetical protein